ncbi:DUF1002 domain-containing protein [Loigolactobacillus coryniformis]|uniref:Inosine-5-monophosphate dehydrogenase n=1 Tax=Loigolactobacillus coryniformis subsp. torquens DSM 20004 = KCTC 3535 TaxID=1423822 RepID=A0A2D1KQC5_9LACO|nr:DUF1002 domain-containing protein [Loigolactobacillus coryniformis]ATO44330.1 inosine-5-monophosphate dehydrogenase [Loigolactobacillus coryniformis subsp. torquens DSM 20004 = KCTC 3535]KRK82193.1 hypothetical protein FC16_GL002015 [Loigolactobacillus coryniformis subsp. torquens DSM 20004 = KCTC 3535]
MKQTWQKISRRAAVVLVLAGVFFGSGIVAVHADTYSSSSSSKSVVNERWGKPTFIYGGGLNQSQIQETMNIMNINSNDVTTSSVTGQDLVKYLGSGSGDTSVMISSVLVTRESSGHGITVKIDTPSNITQITANEYKNPLITAGITDATIEVASVKPVTGESALTGVYKAFEANGETVDPDRAALGQEELETTNSVAQDAVKQNATDNPDQSSSESKEDANKIKLQLANALTDIKQQLADLKEQGKTANTTQITTIVNNSIKDNNLSGKISQNNIKQLVNLAGKYQTTSGVLDKSTMNQLDKAKSSIGSALDKVGGALKNAQNSSWWQQFTNWVKSVWQSIFG